jgi:tripartite-type tricarboxylate transporter receptor subunit TctC
MLGRRRDATGQQLALCAVVALPLPAAAQQGWHDHPIRIIVPFPPGNSSDVSMRLIAEELSGSLRQSVVVENRTGPGGAIATAYAARLTAL